MPQIYSTLQDFFFLFYFILILFFYGLVCLSSYLTGFVTAFWFFFMVMDDMFHVWKNTVSSSWEQFVKIRLVELLLMDTR